MQFTIREYRDEDFDTLWMIDQACFAPGIAYTRYELRTYIRRRGSIALVAESVDCEQTARPTVLGFVVAETIGRGVGHIITIDVRPEARRHRVGSALLLAAEEKLRSGASHSVRLEAAVNNVSALSFYKRHGYDVVSVIPHYYSNGVDALNLEKKLLSLSPAS